MLSQKINHWISDYQYEVILCTSEQRGRSFVYPLSPNAKHIDLGVNYNRKNSYFHPTNLLKSILYFSKLRRLLLKETPDVIISVNNTPEQYFLPFMSKSIPKIKEFHSSGVTTRVPKGIIERLKHFLFLLLGLYQAKVVLNSDEKQYYRFKNVEVIPNFVEERIELSGMPREKTIIAAGRIAPVKQFDHLIKAWSILENEFPEWTVKIFGEGDSLLSEQLEQTIRSLGLNNIKLMGSRPDLGNEMQRASLFAMTSATECFPMVLLEAQAAGLPIISYDCPHGPKNIINNGEDGVLTTHNDINAFAVSLRILLANREFRTNMEQQCSGNISKFSSDSVMERWDTLVKKLLIESAHV